MKRTLSALTLAALLAPMTPTLAQTTPTPKPTVTQGTATPAAPSSASTGLPDRTTASFGDWTLRCERRRDGATPAKLCELSQAIQRAGDSAPLAQVAIGRLSASEPLRLTLVLPFNVALTSAPKVSAEAKDAFPVQQTAWQRCVPGGCLASVNLSDDIVKKVRTAGDAARMEYRDAGEREVTLGFSLRGLPEALDALSRESTN